MRCKICGGKRRLFHAYCNKCELKIDLVELEIRYEESKNTRFCSDCKLFNKIFVDAYMNAYYEECGKPIKIKRYDGYYIEKKPANINKNNDCTNYENKYLIEINRIKAIRKGV